MDTERRKILKATNAVTLGGTLSALSAADAAAERLYPKPADESDGFEVNREQATSVFPLSVASGGPTPSGALLWTRVAPNAYDGETPLGIEVGEDDAFDTIAYQGTVPAEEFGPNRDFTATVDLDGELAADRQYFYRFVYDGDASEIGRCRTLPKPDASPDSVRFAVASCNHYLHGYFGAFARIAEEDVDFLVHLGDFIYEDGGDGTGDRSIDLPSGEEQAVELADYRYLYRTYRSDELLRRALKRHTLVHTWDDAEVVDARWWNYDTNAPETRNHPRGDDPEFMRQLYVDAIRAYTEYVPVRATYEPADGTGENRELPTRKLHETFRLYRSFKYGDLVELFVTDERLYRSSPPASEEYEASVPVETAIENPGRTMLGDDQRRWFLQGVTNSDARWKLWANEVLAAVLRFVRDGHVEINAQAWDGYHRERRRILSTLADADVDNFVTMTGDMHSYLAAYLLRNYELVPWEDELSGGDRTTEKAGTRGTEERVGVEFMAPAISSDNLVEIGYLPDVGTEGFVAGLLGVNPHVEWFDSSHWGYATVAVGRDELIYSAYAVDRSVDSADASKRLLRRYRVPAGEVTMERVDDGNDGT